VPEQRFRTASDVVGIVWIVDRNDFGLRDIELRETPG